VQILFVHQNFPGQWRHLAPAMAGAGHKVVCMGQPAAYHSPGISYISYAPPQGANKGTHPYIQDLEGAVRRGQQVARSAMALRTQGFKPDLICCHPGWGEGLYLKDVFPDARCLYYWEFFYKSKGADVGFDPQSKLGIDDLLRVRTKNSTQLISFTAADWGLTPTQWQKSVYPDWMQQKMSVIHEGVDTDAIRPLDNPRCRLADGRELTRDDEVVTYISRNLEPYRGFVTFMRSLPELQRMRPRAQVIIVGADGVSYGTAPPGGGNWRQTLLKELEGKIDLSRVHFTGMVPHAQLHAIMRVSSAHIYLTFPFVLSWSMVESMACGCLIIGSNTPTVTEVLQHERNGLLTDFFSPEALAATINQAIERQSDYAPLRAAARKDAVEKFDLRKVTLPRQTQLLHAVAEGRFPRVATA